jgi:hypothetical protein
MCLRPEWRLVIGFTIGRGRCLSAVEPKERGKYVSAVTSTTGDSQALKRASRVKGFCMKSGSWLTKEGAGDSGGYHLENIRWQAMAKPPRTDRQIVWDPMC